MKESVENKRKPFSPIRTKEQGIKGEASRYLKKLHAVKIIPGGTGVAIHSISWPIDMRYLNAHITAYFDEPNYSFPLDGIKHEAVDIQVPLGTPVFAPEKAKLLQTDTLSPWNKPRGLADIFLYSEKTNFLYGLGHLDANSIPKRLLIQNWFNTRSELQVEEGEIIGRVGNFYSKHVNENGFEVLGSSIQIPPDVLKIYGRTYNHLHIEMQYPQDRSDIHRFHNDFINPIIFLKRLY